MTKWASTMLERTHERIVIHCFLPEVGGFSRIYLQENPNLSSYLRSVDVEAAMKLRIRSLKTKETIPIVVPEDCSVQQLKEVICSRISAAPPVSPDGLLVSLNRNDELSGSSLQSVGVTSGDLIYYSVKISDCTASSSEPMDEQVDDSVTHDKPRAKSVMGVDDQPMELDAGEGSVEGLLDVSKGKSVNLNAVEGETETLKSLGPSNAFENSAEVVEGSQDTKVVYAEEGDAELLLDTKRSISVPSFLKKVFENEVVGISSGNTDQKLLAVAVHAALMESGFVGYDPILKKRVDGICFPDQWPFRVVHYTTPEVLFLKEGEEVPETIVLKFQGLGKFLNVIGSSSKKEFLYRICLDGSRFMPALNFLRWNGDSTDEKNVSEEEKLRAEKEVFELWKTVKDGLAHPLLIDLCENAGLEPPSCFIQLPTEIKLNILEMLPGPDIAKVACTCSELRFVSSNDDLWRQKYREEFGENIFNFPTGWKDKFCMFWKARYQRFGYRYPFGQAYTAGPIVRGDPIRPFRLSYPVLRSDPDGEYHIPHRLPYYAGPDDAEFRLPHRLPFLLQNRGRPFSPPCDFGRRFV